MRKINTSARRTVAACLSIAGLLFGLMASAAPPARSVVKVKARAAVASDPSIEFVKKMVTQGRAIFRFDTFGDEQFWGDTLQLHQTIQGAKFGGVGDGLTPAMALALGLKVDVAALPAETVQALKAGQVNLNDVATTLALIKLNAVVGVKGTFNTAGSLQSIGITCALCHSTVDNSLAPGVGQRLDGWANRDLDVGSIIAFAPNMEPFVNLLKTVIPAIDAQTVRDVLHSWGPGKFDAELLFDGKAFNTQQATDGVITSSADKPVPGATLLPNAFGHAGVNLHTWTGDWGSVPYWNALVAVLEMRGVGNFFDPRLDDHAKFPIAAANDFGHMSVDPDKDQVTSKLPALHFYQLSLAAPKPTAGVDFDAAAAKRGDELFSGRANCSSCHAEPLWTEPGLNMHSPEEMRIDAFQASRAPGDSYRTMNLAGIFVRERGLFMKPENKGRFYHDGRFATLREVVDSYDSRFSLGLSDTEKNDLVEYLKSL